MNNKSTSPSGFLFRCDVSPELGMGHLQRCLTLAEELKRQNVFTVFACRADRCRWEKYACQIADECLELKWSLSPSSDSEAVISIYRQKQLSTAIVDHYRVDSQYQAKMLEAGIRWMQFDWAAQQPFLADWVLNASPAARESDYTKLKQRSETKFLLGPFYALLRAQFYQWRHKATVKDKVRKILLTFGGGDDRGAIIFCLEAVKNVCNGIECLVLVSSSDPSIGRILDWMKDNKTVNVTISVDEPEVARRMAESDIAITAGGTTTFETAAMGLPSLIIQLAENQKQNAEAWAKNGTAINIGEFGQLEMNNVTSQLKKLVDDFDLRKTMSERGKALVDGLGAQRVAEQLLS